MDDRIHLTTTHQHHGQTVLDRLRRGRQDRLRRPPPSQARTRGAALKFLKEQVGRTCLRGVVFTITEIPVPLIREIVAEILAGGDLPVAAPTPPPAATNDTATPEPAPKPARKSKPKPPPALSDGKPGNPGFGDDLWQKVRAHWEECRNYRKAAEAFGLSHHTVKTRARREGWNK